MAAIPTLSVVLPVFNEEATIQELNRRLVASLEALELSFEVIYVDDGSTDRSKDLLRELARDDARVGVLGLSRNFGHQIALSAGLDYARGDAVILMEIPICRILPSSSESSWGVGRTASTSSTLSERRAKVSRSSNERPRTSSTVWFA